MPCKLMFPIQNICQLAEVLPYSILSDEALLVYTGK